jgi:hypothetical protein
MKSQKTLNDWAEKAKRGFRGIVTTCQEMDELIFTRFLWYCAILSFLLLFSILLFVSGKFEAGAIPLLGFLGMLYLAVSFYRMFRNDELSIVYGICESKDSYTQSLLDKYHTITDKKLRKYEYRVLVMSPEGKESYIYLILNEYNRMREGASYKILFRKTENGEFSEANMVTFKQLQQDIQIYSAKADLNEDTPENSDEEPQNTRAIAKEG